MSKKINLIGVIIGVAIMVCSCFVFSFDVQINNPELKTIQLASVSSPEREEDEWYGGDAYTGIQQAAAQTANNLIPVFDAIEANSNAITKLNKNNIDAAEAEAENAEAIVSTIKYCAGFILLSIGLTVISKSIKFEITLTPKEKPQVTETVV